ncbi:hydrogenase 4 subunit D [Desulfurococcaceae archaeon MEX13E-LK6-19]|nr:hydrogenase 4 subunit D [Desulfurococcaceae archaeon MEX13E-LK6-19]
MDPILIAFLIPILVPFTIGLYLFLLDGRKADSYLLILLSLILSSYIFGTFLFITSKQEILHYIISYTEYTGEFYGFIIDPMSVAVGFVVITAGTIFLVYSIDYMSPNNKFHPVHSGKGRFYGWMLLFIGATLAFIHSSTIIQLLMFFEVMSFSCWGLVSYYGTEKALRSANKALIYTHVGAMIGLFTASSICLFHLHDFSLTAINKLEPMLKYQLFAAAMIAAFSKSAQFPFYSWLPDAMVAPTPASAFLHGAAMVEMGVYLLARLAQFATPLPQGIFWLMLFFIMITGAICMLMYPVQRDAKRLLAYSTIGESMVMYVGVLYATTGSLLGLQATILQLFNHAYVKGLAFLTAGVFGYSLGTHSMEKIKGLIKSSPLIAAAWTLSLLGLTGVPPFGIFYGKLMVISSATIVDHIAWSIIPLLVVLLDSTIFFIVGLSWIHEMVFKECKKPSTISITTLMKLCILSLIVFSLISNYIAYPLITRIRFLGG